MEVVAFIHPSITLRDPAVSEKKTPTAHTSSVSRILYLITSNNVTGSCNFLHMDVKRTAVMFTLPELSDTHRSDVQESARFGNTRAYRRQTAAQKL